ncbi:TetR/AcrR family transcriptional regulator [Bradyrhizobium sp. 31Argb]|uniref:TetR/AcrR family transcriptional regulator n=1 Tax=unclassified Bradyrhizobium TaxID=2631580 RepID=UPI00102EB757|nr:MULTISPECIES: TetR/AcrR family transcriptional regulator [unclassified Bradyrhizobium]MDI4238933.1 TetR/AcrR family transcriptional regulator [Bradyrhizobium sp. Arg237L]TAI64133.1 TetR family transcriptional regulator [Bradyrhizobium sp. Leo170]
MADLEAKLRADAQANRDRILDVARDAFAADPGTSLNSIAKIAGVGAGTLYRHFPTREALLVGVYRKEIGALVELAPKLLTKHPPLQAFRLWCDRFVRFGEVKHGVADTLRAAISDQDFQETYRPLVEAVRRLMEACEGSGDIRPGAEPEDVLTLLGLLLRISPTSDGKAQTKRVLALIFRGLGAEE